MYMQMPFYRKRAGADPATVTLAPSQQRYYALMGGRAELEALLQKGVDTARESAAVTLRTVKERVGLTD
jgi:hypothetical protein